MGIVDGRYDRNWVVRDASKRTSDRPRGGGTHVCIYLFMRSNIGIYLFRYLSASAPSCRRAFLSFPARGCLEREILSARYLSRYFTRLGIRKYYFVVLLDVALNAITWCEKYFPTRHPIGGARLIILLIDARNLFKDLVEIVARSEPIILTAPCIGYLHLRSIVYLYICKRAYFPTYRVCPLLLEHRGIWNAIDDNVSFPIDFLRPRGGLETPR